MGVIRFSLSENQRSIFPIITLGSRFGVLIFRKRNVSACLMLKKCDVILFMSDNIIFFLDPCCISCTPMSIFQVKSSNQHTI